MNRLRFKVLIRCVAAMAMGCASGGGTGNDGTYTLPHEISLFDGEVWHTTPVEDVLTLSTTRSGDLNFHLDITANNMHTCQMEGTAMRAGNSFEYRNKPGEYGEPGDEPCLLRITPTREAIIVEDVGSRCRMVWCGVRASIGRSVFPRNPSPSTPAPPEALN